MVTRTLLTLASTWFLAGGCLAQPPKAPPAAPPSDGAEKVLQEIQAQFVAPERSLSREERDQMLRRRMENVLGLGAEAEQKFPDSEKLYPIRVQMLQAAEHLARQTSVPAARSHLIEIARRVMASKAPPEMKIEADRILTGDKVAADKGAVEEEIRALVRRYDGTPAAGAACAYGALLALQNRKDKLRDELIAVLEARYLDNPRIRGFLRQMHRHPDVGRPFTAALQRLDGKTLTLPEDLLGKVVVIDFWATWCPPCRDAAAEMKALFKTYHPRGVEFVGISLDTHRAAVEEFLKTYAVPYTQTFSGKGWDDPTASEFDIHPIPSVWVVGKDGKVFSDNARDNLEQVIQKALGAK